MDTNHLIKFFNGNDEELYTGISMAAVILSDTADATYMLRKIKANINIMYSIEKGFRWIIQTLDDRFKNNINTAFMVDGETYLYDLQACREGVREALDLILALKRGDLMV